LPLNLTGKDSRRRANARGTPKASAAWCALPKKKALSELAAAAEAGPDWRAIQAKARAEALAPLLWGLRGEHLSLISIAEEMNRRAIPTPGGSRWGMGSVSRMLLATREMVPNAEAISAAADRRTAPARQRALGLAPLVLELREQGKTLRAIAGVFTRRGIPSTQGKPWNQTSVRQVLVIAAKAEAERTGVAPRAPFRTPPLDPKARVMGVAARMWKLKALGKSTAAIVSELNRLKIKPVKCGRWHPATVDRVLKLTAGRFPEQVTAAEIAPSSRMLLARERASKLAPLVRKLRKRMSFNEVAAELTRRGVPTPFGGRQWWGNDRLEGPQTGGRSHGSTCGRSSPRARCANAEVDQRGHSGDNEESGLT
jgi:hypothetical protein